MSNNDFKKGFTLVETLVAITILIVAIEGPLVLAAKSLQTSNYSNNQIVAQYLAQEGLEAVRLKRDNNGLASRNWTDGMDDCFTDECIVDAWGDVSFMACGVAQCPNVQFQNDQYGQSQAGWSDSQFRREITLQYVKKNGTENNEVDGTPTPKEYEMRVKSSVYWTNGSSPTPHSITVTGNLFNWRKIEI
jgi:prepilin-type N-terminal cleavage/methylation domain-containing protein